MALLPSKSSWIRYQPKPAPRPWPSYRSLRLMARTCPSHTHRRSRARFGSCALSAVRTRSESFIFADARRVFVLLHGFVKRTAKLESSELRQAEYRMAQHNLLHSPQANKKGKHRE